MDSQMKEVKDDIRELKTDFKSMALSVTRIATAMESEVPQLRAEIKELSRKHSEVEGEVRQIKLERARESTAREWLHKNWIALAVIIALMASESVILSKLI